jgi:tetratricopeptide (TPR) repeat protein
MLMMIRRISNTAFHIQRAVFFCVLTVTAIAPAKPEYKVEEQGNNMILVTPKGRRILFGDQQLSTQKSYEFEIPLAEVSEKETQPDREPASSQKPTPTPEPYTYDVDWDWEEPDDDPVPLPASSPTPSPTPTPSPAPTPKVELDLSDSLILKANHLYHKGRFFEANLYVEELLRKHPESLRGWLMKGSLLYKLGHKDLATKAWEKAIALDPDRKLTQGLLERFK